jgi:hypothetical protein
MDFILFIFLYLRNKEKTSIVTSIKGRCSVQTPYLSNKKLVVDLFIIIVSLKKITIVHNGWHQKHLGNALDT